ncbi:DinB family protein [Rhodoflexus sp.]
MQPAIEQAFQKMERWRLTMQALVADYSAQDQRFQPNAGSWSMLQVMKHLIIAETSILNAIKKNLQRQELADNNLSQKLGYWLTKTILRLPVKIKAPVEALIPEVATDYEKVVAEWGSLRAKWRDLLENFPPELIHKNVFRHPVAGFFTIGQTIDFCCYHIKHHLQQIDRIGQVIKQKAS